MFLAHFPIFIAGLIATLAYPAVSYAQLVSHVSIPLDEKKSQPATDLMKEGVPIHGKELDDIILGGESTAQFEPQLSDLYVGHSLSAIEPDAISFPTKTDTLTFLNSLPTVGGLTQARIFNSANPGTIYLLSLSLDTHAALARNALFRRLGYAIPSPKYYRQLSLQFSSVAERDQFLDLVSSTSYTNRNRWVVGGADELAKNNSTIILQDVALESSLIGEIPRLHWGIFTNSLPGRNAVVTNYRRSIRALLVPMSLVDIPEAVNTYSFEAAKISNQTLVFSRPANSLYDFLGQFEDEASIGDILWIVNKLAALGPTREPWKEIIRAAHYPPAIEALLIEKFIERINQLMALLEIKKFTPVPNNPKLTAGINEVIAGKAKQEWYDGYALRFVHQDPKNPLDADSILRYFGIEAISGGIETLLAQANQYLQIFTAQNYIDAHKDKYFHDLEEHISKHTGTPYIQPVEAWGGPVGGFRLNAARHVMTGTYYGSNSPVQLVDSIGASVMAGAFIGVSGLGKFGASASPQINYTRSYIHVRPVEDMKSAWKNNWKNLMVPVFMNHLGKVLSNKNDSETQESIKAFLETLKAGEIFMITDSVAGASNVSVGAPIGALLGLTGAFTTINESVSLVDQYAVLGRTMFSKTADDTLQVYITRAHTGRNELQFDTQFYIKLLSEKNSKTKGIAHTKAFLFPETFKDPNQAQAFQRGILALLRKNNASIIENQFGAHFIDHKAKSTRHRLEIGPVAWSHRETVHQVDILPPPKDGTGPGPLKHKRTVIQGTNTRIHGTDLYGFFGQALHSLVSYANIGTSNIGDDPASNFMGRSTTTQISTQIEITPSRPNHLFTQISQWKSGWTIKKDRLLKMVRKIIHQLHEFDPQKVFFSEAEFTQATKIISYSIRWNLLLYEPGLQKILEVFNTKKTSPSQAKKLLINAMGKSEYEAYCRSHRLKALITDCTPNWMAEVFWLRLRLQKHPELFAIDIHETQMAGSKVKWVDRVLNRLQKKIPIDYFLRWVGKENTFFQVSVTGFRVHDENDNPQYFSNTFGQADREIRGGPLSDISQSTGVVDHELSARYLSDGY